MSQDERIKETLIAKFKPFTDKAGGGIFTKKTRERLLGLRVASGRDRTRNQFWYDVRNNVKNALVDLELFIETTDKDQLDQVLTRKSLEPVIAVLFQGFKAYSETEADLNRADIADMLILLAFRYLKEKARKGISLSHSRTIDEAVDLTDFLLHMIKGETYYTPEDMFGRKGRLGGI
jgi:hypothetical protein